MQPQFRLIAKAYNDGVNQNTKTVKPKHILKKGNWEYSHYVVINGQKIYLSIRQAECLKLLKNHTEEKIAKKLGLAVGTISCYLQNIKAKLNCVNKKQLLKIAERMKEIDLD